MVQEASMQAATRAYRRVIERAPSGGGVRRQRPRCLIAPAHRDLKLTRALLDHLSAGLPGVEFIASTELEVDSVWVCGYDERPAGVVGTLRKRYPDATMLVSHRGFDKDWQATVSEAGADYALRWPLSTDKLARLLGGSEER